MLVVSLFFTVIGLLAAAFGIFILFLLLSFACLMAITNKNIVEINDEKNYIHDYNLFLGFIKKGKKYPLDKYKYITNMPLIQSEQVYASSSNFINISHNYFTIALFSERFLGKRIITMLDSKAEAIEKATKLAERLNLKFFEYDPTLVREVLLGQRTL